MNSIKKHKKDERSITEALLFTSIYILITQEDKGGFPRLR